MYSCGDVGYATVVMNNLNIDQTIEYVRKIVENIQCAICDKTDGQRLRYVCGHTACDDCVINAVDCPICLTPPEVSSPQPKLDDVLTQRVKNALKLLKVCQDLFDTDVFKHKRLSEQLRIEKELFPECIQAPMKYENKRKTTFLSNKNKENRNSNFFPGEETSLLNENMTKESSARYVQQWLNKNEKDFTRKPFTDLNVNTELDRNIIILPKNNYELQNKKDKNVSVLKTNRKRSHFKTTVKNDPSRCGNIESKINKHNSNSKKIKKELNLYNTDLVRNKTKTKCDNDESGIFIDDDLIVIDDSQETIDKDRNAWLAVLKANENEEIESTSQVKLDCSDHKTLIFTNEPTPTKSDGLQSKLNPGVKVPFYKKSYITEICTYCNGEANKGVGQSENFEIIIDNANFTTTIKILKDVENSSKLNKTNSVSVQTDICKSIPENTDGNIRFANLNEKNVREYEVSQKSVTQSEDLFDEGQNNDYKQNNLHDCLIVAESDSDMEMERSGPLSVKVDVHRSCDESEYGILSEIVNTQEHNTRPRRGPRGLTPTSTDSSEKENYNPNRLKKQTSKKKKYLKKD